MAGLTAANPGSASVVNVDMPDGGFFSGANVARRATLDAAGHYFSTILQDTLNAIDSNGTDQFTAVFQQPDTGTVLNLTSFDVAADTLTIFVGGRDLGASTLGQGSPGGYSISGTQSFLNQAAYRGETGAQPTPHQTFLLGVAPLRSIQTRIGTSTPIRPPPNRLAVSIFTRPLYTKWDMCWG